MQITMAFLGMRIEMPIDFLGKKDDEPSMAEN